MKSIRFGIMVVFAIVATPLGIGLAAHNGLMPQTTRAVASPALRLAHPAYQARVARASAVQAASTRNARRLAANTDPCNSGKLASPDAANQVPSTIDYFVQTNAVTPGTNVHIYLGAYNDPTSTTAPTVYDGTGPASTQGTFTVLNANYQPLAGGTPSSTWKVQECSPDPVLPGTTSHLYYFEGNWTAPSIGKQETGFKLKVTFSFPPTKALSDRNPALLSVYRTVIINMEVLPPQASTTNTTPSYLHDEVALYTVPGGATSQAPIQPDQNYFHNYNLADLPPTLDVRTRYYFQGGSPGNDPSPLTPNAITGNHFASTMRTFDPTLTNASVYYLDAPNTAASFPACFLCYSGYYDPTGGNYVPQTDFANRSDTGLQAPVNISMTYDASRQQIGGETYPWLVQNDTLLNVYLQPRYLQPTPSNRTYYLPVGHYYVDNGFSGFIRDGVVRGTGPNGQPLINSLVSNFGRGEEFDFYLNPGTPVVNPSACPGPPLGLNQRCLAFDPVPPSGIGPDTILTYKLTLTGTPKPIRGGVPIPRDLPIQTIIPLNATQHSAVVTLLPGYTYTTYVQAIYNFTYAGVIGSDLQIQSDPGATKTALTATAPPTATLAPVWNRFTPYMWLDSFKTASATSADRIKSIVATHLPGQTTSPTVQFSWPVGEPLNFLPALSQDPQQYSLRLTSVGGAPLTVSPAAVVSQNYQITSASCNLPSSGLPGGNGLTAGPQPYLRAVVHSEYPFEVRPIENPGDDLATGERLLWSTKSLSASGSSTTFCLVDPSQVLSSATTATMSYQVTQRLGFALDLNQGGLCTLTPSTTVQPDLTDTGYPLPALNGLPYHVPPAQGCPVKGLGLGLGAAQGALTTALQNLASGPAPAGLTSITFDGNVAVSAANVATFSLTIQTSNIPVQYQLLGLHQLGVQ